MTATSVLGRAASSAPPLQTPRGDWANWCIQVLLSQACAHFSERPGDDWDLLATEHAESPLVIYTYRPSTDPRITNACAVCVSSRYSDSSCAVHAPLLPILSAIGSCLHYAEHANIREGDFASIAAQRFCQHFVPTATRDGLMISLVAQLDWSMTLAETYAAADAVTANSLP